MKKKQTKKVVSKKSESKSESRYIPSENTQATMIVKIISVYEYIMAGIIFGLILVFARQFVLKMLPIANIPQVSGPVSVEVLIGRAIVLMGVMLIALGIFGIFLARALWNHKNWARIVIIVFSSMGVLSALFSLPSGIFGLIISGGIVYFLGFDKNVIALFK
jgi:hypothetical protein